MSVSLSPLARQQFSVNGVPVSGGLLFTYAAGTTNKLATYTDASGATPNTNPVVLDSQGQADVWMTAGTKYKLVLSPANDTDPPTNPYWTRDNIVSSVDYNALASSSGSSLAGHSDAVHPIPYLKTVSDILNGAEISLLRYVPLAKQDAIRSGTNTDDAGPWLVTALAEGGALFIPDGIYNIYTTASYTGSRNHKIRGAGMGSGSGLNGGTRLIAQADVDLLSFNGGSILGISDMTLSANLAMANGLAIHVESDNTTKLALTAERLYISGASASTEFRKGIYVNNGNDIRVDKVMCVGRSDINSAMNAIEITGTLGAATVHDITNCSMYNTLKGVAVSNTHNPGVEGLKVFNCDMVNVNSGVEYINTSTYSPPQIDVSHCHINTRTYGIYAQSLSQFFADSNDIYVSGSVNAEAIHADGTTPPTIRGNQIYVIGAGDCTGISVIGTNTGGSVTNNYISLKSGTSKVAISLGSGISGLSVKDNFSVNAAACVSDGSAATNVNYIDNNLNNGALDAAYANPTVASSAGILDVRKVKLGGYATLTDNGTLITGLTGSPGQFITIVFNNPVTFQHNAGLLLKGQVNYVGAAGNTITLFKEAGAWREVARTN